MAGYIPTGCMVCGQPPHADPVASTSGRNVPVTYHTYVPQQMTRTSPAWRAIRDEANRWRWPRHNRWDLWIDYLCVTEGDDSIPSIDRKAPFLWGLRESGTHIVFHPAGTVANRLRSYSDEPIRWYLWDGATLEHVFASDAQRRFKAAYEDYDLLRRARTA